MHNDRRRIFHKVTLVLVLVALPLASTGCVFLAIGGAAAAGAGTVAYLKGELTSTEDVSLESAYFAFGKALSDLEYPITDQAKNSHSAYVKALSAADKSIKVNLEKVAHDVTKVDIRVGVFGNEDISRLLLDKARANFPRKTVEVGRADR
jgi:hypothetical protein